MSNALIAMDKSGSFRVYLALTRQMAEEGRRIHNPTPTGTAALSRVLTGAGLMGLMLKNTADKLTVQLKGDGPIGEILATANGGGQVKGYLSNPEAEVPLRPNGRLDVGGGLGIGILTVIKDMGLREPWVGKIDFVSGEVAEDLTMYFFVSEQQSTSVALGEVIGADGSVEAAGGMIIQMMPDADQKAVEPLEQAISQMGSFSQLLSQAEKNRGIRTEEDTLNAVLNQVFSKLPAEYQMEILEYRSLAWECDCSRERLEQVMLTIGKENLTQILEEDGQAEVVCQFCRKDYGFDREQLAHLLAEMQKD